MPTIHSTQSVKNLALDMIGELPIKAQGRLARGPHNRYKRLRADVTLNGILVRQDGEPVVALVEI